MQTKKFCKLFIVRCVVYVRSNHLILFNKWIGVKLNYPDQEVL